MAITWTASTATTTNICGAKGVAGSPLNTFTERRLYFKFRPVDLDLIQSDYASAVLQVTVTAVTSTGSYYLRSAKTADSNWGATITSDATDWTTTEAHLEDTLSIGATGTQQFDVDLDNIDWADTAYFRIQPDGPGLGTNNAITVGMQNHATEASRPVLILTEKSGAVVRLLALTGVGT
jgi:hypothetical protein